MTSKTSKNKNEDKKYSLEKSPLNMEEILSKYGKGYISLFPGDKVKGVVLRKESGRLILDIGGKLEGLVAEKAYKEAESLIKTLEVGDEVEATVLIPETREGYTVVSLRKFVEEEIWRKVIESYEKGIPLLVSVKSVNPAGVIVNIDQMQGFIPVSQLGKKFGQEFQKNPSSLIGKSFEAVVIDFDRSIKKVILSEKEVSEKEELEKVRRVIKEIKIGEAFDGKVLGIYDFGCFVEIKVPFGKGKNKEKVPIEGLVHISELSWERVEKPTEIVQQRQKVKVKVIGKKNEKLAFSIKQAQKDPWSDIEKMYEKDKRIKGKVAKISDFGLFVSIEPGVEGLVHITKIPPGKKYKVGDDVNVYVEEIDKEKKRLSLGLVLTEKPIGYK